MNKEVLEDFRFLVRYHKETGKIDNFDGYTKDISAFLVHARHLKSYDLVGPFCKDSQVLDIGCFLGYGEKRINGFAQKIVAIDINEDALSFARRNYSLPNVEYSKADPEKLLFENKSFDVVIAFQLLEHFPPKRVPIFLQEVKRILKKDGLFILTTPNRKNRLRLFQRPFNPQHYQEFTAQGLKITLKKVFKDVEIMGVRAEEWIERIEKTRVQQSFCCVYFLEPLSKFFKKFLSKKEIDFLRRIKSKIELAPISNEEYKNNELSDELYNKFSMNSFYLEKQKRLLDKSLDLFAICRG